MKRIGLTQRVDIIPSYGERRDALDQQWYSLLLKMNMLPIPLPNTSSELVSKLVEEFHLDGVIFTGGNSLSHLNESALDQAPERDMFELEMIRHALDIGLPLFGVCRGMQILNHYFGGVLKPISGHVANQHPIFSVDSDQHILQYVNSFHDWAVPNSGLGDGLEIVAVDLQGNIEAFIHTQHKVAGIMWHPERKDGDDTYTLNLMEKILL